MYVHVESSIVVQMQGTIISMFLCGVSKEYHHIGDVVYFQVATAVHFEYSIYKCQLASYRYNDGVWQLNIGLIPIRICCIYVNVFVYYKCVECTWSIILSACTVDCICILNCVACCIIIFTNTQQFYTRLTKSDISSYLAMLTFLLTNIFK